ncbi:hypothetical protein MUO79_05000 [Candidatus Bathyarchaeota archaeon]|nr:hypothetical protein [Candidatus Bathyarchaeota archaeon]
MGKSLDTVFICSAIVFNISVSVLYIATKLDNTLLLRVCSAIVLSLIFPFTITLLGYVKEKAEMKILIPHLVILFYLLLELLFDYILVIPFREMLAIHVAYIIVFYAADFSMIGVSFNRNRKMGFVVTLTFWILIGCLVYLYLG